MVESAYEIPAQWSSFMEQENLIKNRGMQGAGDASDKGLQDSGIFPRETN